MYLDAKAYKGILRKVEDTINSHFSKTTNAK